MGRGGGSDAGDAEDARKEDAVYSAAELLFEVFVEAVSVGEKHKFRCVLDQREFSTRDIATAHLYKSHRDRLEELMPQQSDAVDVDDAVDVIDVVDVEAIQWQTQEDADELAALQLALDEYEEQQQLSAHRQVSELPQRQRQQPHRRYVPIRSTQLEERPKASSLKRRQSETKPSSKQERLMSLLTKTDDILLTVQVGYCSFSGVYDSSLIRESLNTASN